MLKKVRDFLETMASSGFNRQVVRKTSFLPTFEEFFAILVLMKYYFYNDDYSQLLLNYYYLYYEPKFWKRWPNTSTKDIIAHIKNNVAICATDLKNETDIATVTGNFMHDNFK